MSILNAAMHSVYLSLYASETVILRGGCQRRPAAEANAKHAGRRRTGRQTDIQNYRKHKSRRFVGAQKLTKVDKTDLILLCNYFIVSYIPIGILT